MQMIQPDKNLKSTKDTHQYEYSMSLFKQKEKVYFDLLPFIGFNDNISYIKIKEKNMSNNNDEEVNQQQSLLKSDYGIDDLQYEIKDEYTSDIGGECCIDSKTEYCQKLILSNNDFSSNFTSDSDEISPTVCKKSKIRLNEKALTFKENFYQLFTFKKKFPKKFVVQIHNSICRQLGLRRVNRDETRSIDKYFQHFAQYSDKILKCRRSVPISMWTNLMPSLFKIQNINTDMQSYDQK